MGFDYFALGHFHTFQLFYGEAGIFCYPGSPQRYSFREVDGEKGVVVLDVERGFSEDNIWFRPLPCREVVVKEVEL
ncbi:MAG: nuclease, partial [Candidatus Verstraetearchaeota archaeon]|nr:nuclease [Candidatus Verstraetearchaeota archaeon]